MSGEASAVAYGGGINSTAMIIWLVKMGIHIDVILFADTGGENPRTYIYIDMFSEWLVGQGWPPIIKIKKGGRDETLEQYCHRTGFLPSLAYGTKGCSWKFKIEPQNRECNNVDRFKEVWKSGRKVIKYIGYSAEEKRRVLNAKKEDDKYIYRFPLYDNGIYRDGCERIINDVGLPLPGKSACFFCPASKKSEILNLRDGQPDLYERAIALEDMAAASGRHNNTLIKGLGRHFSWRDPIQDDLFTPTGCFNCVDDADDRGDLDG